MRRFLKFCVFLIFLIFLSLLLSPSAFATSLDCATCHGTKVADFNYPNVPRVDRLTVCWKCHNDAMGLGVYLTSSGWFASPSSPLSEPEVIHPNHAGYNIYGGIAYQFTSCGKCHGPVDCNACHTWGSTTPQVPHATHPSARYSSLTHSVSDSITRSYKNFYCTRVECHTTWTTIVTKRSDGTDLCLNCHSQDKSASTHITLHTPNPTLIGSGGSCDSCHINNLPQEHESRGLNCNTCHAQSSRARPVINAWIAGGRQENQKAGCPTCHADIPPDLSSNASHISLHTPNPTLIGTLGSCDSCHINNLPQEHEARGLNCNTCHSQSSRARPVIDAWIAGGRQENQKAGCPTCHADIPPDLSSNANHRPYHNTDFDTDSPGITDSCSLCHNLNTSMIPYDLWDIHMSRSTTSYPTGMDCNSCHGLNQGGKLVPSFQ